MKTTYQIIYADPPWTYRDKALSGKRGAGCKYPVQTKEWLKSLDIGSLADANCTLFLWVTMPLLDECFEVLTAWGFTYKTVAFTWVKRNKKSPSWFWGMGNWTRANAELCLLATRGKPKRISASVHSVIESPIRGHSQKPEEARDRIVDLMGDVPRVELFARERVPGWDAMGFDIDGRNIKDVVDSTGTRRRTKDEV